MARIAKNYVILSLDVAILCHVLTDHLDVAVRSLFKNVNNQLRTVATEIVKEHCVLEADWALQVTPAVNGADQ